MNQIQECDFEIKCEIKQCMICHKFIEHTNQTVIVQHNHYHRCCLDKLWLQIDKMERYKILNLYLQEERKVKSFLEWFGYDV